jgi:hypothetical protein
LACQGESRQACETKNPKVGADEAPAQQGGRAKYALFAAADDGTAIEPDFLSAKWNKVMTILQAPEK